MTVIDRFEGDTAVLETDNGMLEIHKSQLPENAREGDIVMLSDGIWLADREATEKRRAGMRSRMKRLMKKKDD